MQATHATNSDAFVPLEVTAQTDFANWTELLSDEKKHKGLVRITVEVFAGRAGFREISEMVCCDKEGHAIENAGDVAVIDAPELAAAAYQVARRDHKREARGRYRLQLWYLKKKGQDFARGDYATLLFDANGLTDSEYGTNDPALGTNRLLQAENRELRTYIKDLLGSQVEMGNANAATMLNALSLGQVTMEARIEHADRVSLMNTRATPADWNQRIKDLEKPITLLVSKLSQYLPPPNGRPPGASANPDGGQGAAQKFFEGLSGEQKDKLRDGLEPGCFNAMAELIAGDNAEWMRERNGIASVLQANTALLLRVLTPEQVAEIQRVFS